MAVNRFHRTISSYDRC